MELKQKIKQLYSCPSKDYHQFSRNLLLQYRNDQKFLLILITQFISLPLSMRSQRIIEMFNQIPLKIYQNLLNDSSFNENSVFDNQILGIIHLMRKDFSNADKYLNKSKKLSEKNVHTSFLQSNSAHLQYKFSVAKEILNSLLKNDSKNAIFLDRLGTIALDQHHFERAINAFTLAREYNNNHNHPLMRLTWIYNEFHQYNICQELIDAAKKIDENDPYLFNSIGDLKRYQKKPMEALKNYTKALEISPYEPLFWKNIIMMYLEIGEYDQAEKTLRDLINLYPDKIDSWITYAWLYQEQNKYQKAINKLEEGLERLPNSADLYLEIALCYNELDDMGLPEFEYLQKAREVSPQNINVLNAIGYYYLINDDNEAATEIFNQILNLDSENIVSLIGLATVQFQENHDFASAEKIYERALEIDSFNLQTWVKYGQICFHESKYEKAEKCFKKALSIDPLEIHVLHYLGLISWGINDNPNEAEDYFKRALTYHEDNITISLDLIELYRTELNQLDKAKNITGKLLEILPDNKYLLKILETIEFEINNKKKI